MDDVPTRLFGDTQYGREMREIPPTFYIALHLAILERHYLPFSKRHEIVVATWNDLQAHIRSARNRQLEA